MDGADAIRYILKNGIEGVIVECGVGNGNMEYIWINELLKNNQLRDIYLFDTFSGLVEPTEFDYTRKDTKRKHMNSDEVYRKWKLSIINEYKNGWCYTSLNKVKSKLNSTGYPDNRLHYIVGDVMETLNDKTNIPEKIAILRLDTDWYQSSKYELEQLYDNVVKGGIIIFDDYLHWDGQRRATDEFFASKNIKYDFVDIGNKKTTAIIKKY
jgi:O-methyltransferase